MTYNQWQRSSKLLGLLIGCSAIITELANYASAQIVPDNTLSNEASQVTSNSNVRGFPAQESDGDRYQEIFQLGRQSIHIFAIGAKMGLG